MTCTIAMDATAATSAVDVHRALVLVVSVLACDSKVCWASITASWTRGEGYVHIICSQSLQIIQAGYRYSPSLMFAHVLRSGLAALKRAGSIRDLALKKGSYWW
jgi:hypothetical protein